jgi:hypothetical protein
VQLELALATAARGRRIRLARVEALHADVWAAGWGRSAVTWCYVAFESPAGRPGRPAGRPADRAGWPIVWPGNVLSKYFRFEAAGDQFVAKVAAEM